VCRFAFRSFTELGGLLSYGNDRNDNFRRAATYADRILKGENPSELPVQAPVKYELVQREIHGMSPPGTTRKPLRGAMNSAH
jgi:hypothetical protein